MIILVVMVNAEVKRVFVDQGSLADIIFCDTFDKLGLKNYDMQIYKEELIDLTREKVHKDRFITLHLTLETRPRTPIVKVDFLVVECPSAYNVIVGKSTLNKIGAIISTTCLIMKFFTNNGEIATMKAD